MTQTSIANSRADLPEEYDGLPVRAIYDGLPEFLKGLLRHHKDPQELTIAMYSVLVTSGALIPNVHVIYGERRSYPLLYLLVLLPPASGKSALGLSRLLLRAINNMLMEEYKTALKKYNHELHIYRKGVKAGTSSLPPTPPLCKQILLAGNTTSARLVQQLVANGEDIPVVILETEVDAVSAMLSGDIGAYNSSSFRQAYHNEPITSARKGDSETLIAENPKMVLNLSGTKNQVKALFKGNEDGLFSRFLILELPGNKEWISPRPVSGKPPLQDIYADYGKKYLKLWQQTHKMDTEIKLTETQWNKLDEWGAELLKEAESQGGENARSVAIRHVLMATRFCSTLTFFNCIDGNTCSIKHSHGPITATDRDIAISMELTEYSFRKSLDLFLQMQGAAVARSNNSSRSNFYDALPTEFSMTDAIRIAVSRGVTTRTKDRWLSHFVKEGLLERIGTGKYKKPVA